MHWINHYPLDSAIGFPNTYPLHSDLSDGQGYLTFKQPGAGVHIKGTLRRDVMDTCFIDMKVKVHMQTFSCEKTLFNFITVT